MLSFFYRPPCTSSMHNMLTVGEWCQQQWVAKVGGQGTAGLHCCIDHLSHSQARAIHQRQVTMFTRQQLNGTFMATLSLSLSRQWTVSEKYVRNYSNSSAHRPHTVHIWSIYMQVSVINSKHWPHSQMNTAIRTQLLPVGYWQSNYTGEHTAKSILQRIHASCTVSQLTCSPQPNGHSRGPVVCTVNRCSSNWNTTQKRNNSRWVQ